MLDSSSVVIVRNTYHGRLGLNILEDGGVVLALDLRKRDEGEWADQSE